jgi:hypothetical protein
MEQNKIKRIVFGVAIGVAIGLLFDSILLLTTSAWMIVFILPLVVPVAVPAVFLGILGEKGRLPAVPWVFTALIILIFWPLCALGPVKIREAQFKAWFNQDVPVYAGSKMLSSKIQTMRSDSIPRMTVDFEFETDYSETIIFFRRELPQKGWKITLDKPEVVYASDGRWDQWVLLAKTPKRALTVTIRKSSNERINFQKSFTFVRIYYGVDSL